MKANVPYPRIFHLLPTEETKRCSKSQNDVLYVP